MAKILVSMNENFLKTVDLLAEQEQRSRSELIREALRTYFQKARVKAPEKAVKDASILENLLS